MASGIHLTRQPALLEPRIMQTRIPEICITRPIFILLLAMAFPSYAGDAALRIDNAWVAEAPPSSRVMVAYMTFINTGAQPVKLVAAASRAFKTVEFHETTEKDGVAGMVYHESLDIPAGGRVELKRGGLHLMLFSPTRALRAGDTVSFRFTTAEGQVITQDIEVRRR